jgi:predicted nucleic acid-binding protein
MARIIISDASPLIGLSIVDGLSWLPKLFDTVWIPEEVRREVLPARAAQGKQAIELALDRGWLQLWQEPFEPLTDIDLDEGESACISIALGLSEPVLLIMDERAGRAVAKEKGVAIIGTAALIGEAKKRGLIPSAREAFEVLHQSDFRISANVIRTVLTRVGE